MADDRIMEKLDKQYLIMMCKAGIKKNLSKIFAYAIVLSTPYQTLV